MLCRKDAAHGIEEHRAAEGSVRTGVLIVDGEEGREAVRGVLFQPREREVQLVDKSVTQVVTKNELASPYMLPIHLGREV